MENVTVADITNYEMRIGGIHQSAATGNSFPVENPATGATMAYVAEGDGTDVDRAVQAAHEGFDRWQRMSTTERAEIMSRAADLMRQELPNLVEIEVAQTGRPIRELSAQLARLPEWFDYFGAVARTYETSSPPFGGNYLNYTRRVPLGVVGQVTPWNHPLLILTKKLAPALAAGNAVVAKPSELAPITPLLLADVLEEAGLPAGAYNVVTGFGSTAGKALSEHGEIQKIDLTGGTETGRKVAAIGGGNLIPVSAELGGKAAVIVFDDMELEQAVAGALFAAFIATGQTCVQGARLLVQRGKYEAFVERLLERTEALRVGDPTDRRTEMGPMISRGQCEMVERYVDIARSEGARVAYGGERLKEDAFDQGWFFKPTILTDVTSTMRVAQEEIFGPVTCVIPFDTEDEAIAIANSTVFGLSSSVWTHDIARAHRVGQSLKCGIVWINDHHRIDPSSPWGGFNQSGLGRENGVVAYEQYTELQSIVVNLSDEPFDWYAGDGEKRYS